LFKEIKRFSKKISLSEKPKQSGQFLYSLLKTYLNIFKRAASLDVDEILSTRSAIAQKNPETII
jgi:hypothetical protein